MSFCLVRVDDRMIHGQVVVGWASVMHPNRIILCHNEISANQDEKCLYESTFWDSNVKICVYSVDELMNYIYTNEFTKERCILLVESPHDALHLLELGIDFDVLNVGGLHYKNSKKELNNYLYVDSDDIRSLTKIRERGIKIEGQDVPHAKKVDVMKLVEKKTASYR